MSLKDKEKWEQKYKDNPNLLNKSKPSLKLEKILKMINGKNALEIACGSGRNSIFLAQNGFDVDAFDISQLAIDTLNKKNLKNINAIQLDLEGFIPKEKYYDLVVQTNYLDRNIIPHLANSLKKDGILLIETYMIDKENEKPMSNPHFLLKKDELKTFFQNEAYEILEYDEYLNEKDEQYKMKKQSIIVKRLFT